MCSSEITEKAPIATKSWDRLPRYDINRPDKVGCCEPLNVYGPWDVPSCARLKEGDMAKRKKRAATSTAVPENAGRQGQLRTTSKRRTSGKRGATSKRRTTPASSPTRSAKRRPAAKRRTATKRRKRCNDASPAAKAARCVLQSRKRQQRRKKRRADRHQRKIRCNRPSSVGHSRSSCCHHRRRRNSTNSTTSPASPLPRKGGTWHTFAPTTRVLIFGWKSSGKSRNKPMRLWRNRLRHQ